VDGDRDEAGCGTRREAADQSVSVARRAAEAPCEGQSRQGRDQSKGDDAALRQQLERVVLGVLDGELAGRGLEPSERVLEGAETRADPGARTGEVPGVAPYCEPVGAGLVARHAREAEDAVAGLGWEHVDERH
jgi:hypothetical protein